MQVFKITHLKKLRGNSLGLCVGIKGPQFFIPATNLTVRQAKKNAVVVGVSLVV